MISKHLIRQIEAMCPRRDEKPIPGEIVLPIYGESILVNMLPLLRQAAILSDNKMSFVGSKR